jgi:sec-independent protein translocase protein TatB
MFGLDFLELVVIFIVALVVLGPTRLPEVARKVGRWIGKARAMARDFRYQLESEVTLAELNRMTEETAKRNKEQQAPAQTPPAAPAGDTATPEGTKDEASPLAGSGYPYGAPASPDPATPQPGDDTYSHAHAAGAAPQPWSPEADPAGSSAAAADPAVTGEGQNEPRPATAGSDKNTA